MRMATKMLTKTKTNTKHKLRHYAGEWVAFVGGKVVEHSDGLDDLMKKVEAIGLKGKTSVFLVPRKDEGPYVLIVL